MTKIWNCDIKKAILNLEITHTFIQIYGHISQLICWLKWDRSTKYYHVHFNISTGIINIIFLITIIAIISNNIVVIVSHCHWY